MRFYRYFASLWKKYMRILFVTPYPPSRVRVRAYGFLAELHRHHQVTIVTQCASLAEVADVEKLCEQGYEVVMVREAKSASLVRSGLALASLTPVQVAYARSARFAKAVQHLCEQGDFDVIHVEHLRGIASMMPLLGKYPLVWDAVDCISLLSKHAIAAGPSLSVRATARLEYKRTQRYESKLLRTLHHVVVTSARDRQAMHELLGNGESNRQSSVESVSNITVIPNGVDLDYFHPMALERQPLNLVFSGKMSYHANVSTVLHLYQHIMPLIWQQQPAATLTIVGSKPPQAVQRLGADPRVIVTGYVDDIRPYVARASVMLSPMVYSVGIQNKVLEAMALGTPVIATSQCASALQARPEHDLLVADSPQTFADLTLRLFHDTELRATLSKNGQAYVEQHHDWSTATNALVLMYQQATIMYRERNLLPSHYLRRDRFTPSVGTGLPRP